MRIRNTILIVLFLVLLSTTMIFSVDFTELKPKYKIMLSTIDFETIFLRNINITEKEDKKITINIQIEDSKGKKTTKKLKIKNKFGEYFNGSEIATGYYDAELVVEDNPVQLIEFNNLNVSEQIDLGIDDVPETGENSKWLEVYAIDPTKLQFENAKVTVTAKGQKLYKCADWNFTTQTCYGNWTRIMRDLVPGQNYTITITPSDPGFAEINITDAEHLDENRSFISNIYDKVKEQDDVWSEPIYHNEYVRASFAEMLGNGNVINFYIRNNQSFNTSIDIYEKDGSTLVGSTPIITTTKRYDVSLSMNGTNDIFDFRIVNAEDDLSAFLEFDWVHDSDATGTPLTTLAFFLSSDAGQGGDKAVTSNHDFDETPIQLNDYGDVTEKCEIWDCSAWSASGGDDKPAYCSGGWNCTAWNGVTCSQFKCEAWTDGTAQKVKYCSGGWNCTTWNGSYCGHFNCLTWADGGGKDDAWCDGGYVCNSWSNGVCADWSCASWNAQNVDDHEDYYCSGSWDCTQWNGDSCEIWNCTAAFLSGTDKADRYCSDGWNCSAWNGNYCDQWDCLTPTEGTVNFDTYCDRWNCSTWDVDKKVCQTWDCLEWVTGSNDQRDFYCSGVYDCTAWETFTYEIKVTLQNPDNDSYSISPASFNCSATDNENIANMTLYIWNTDGSLNITNSTTLTGTANSTLFSQTLDDSTYLWNCLAYDNASNSDWGDNNRTITIDTIPPNTTLINPQDASIDTDGNTFTCNATDSVGLKNITLYIWNSSGSIYNTYTETISGTSNQTSWSIDLIDSTYIWNCLASDSVDSDWGDSNWTVTVDTSNLSRAPLSFFMTDLYGGGDKGVDGNDFDEFPIQLNDYGHVTNKCELWDCTGWTQAAQDKQNYYCTGGWNCTGWNGAVCAQYKCENWAFSATDRTVTYCSDGWDCLSWNGTVCEFWNCTAWTEGIADTEYYCDGTWNCTNWNIGRCDYWGCTNWNSVIGKIDRYCSGEWDCTDWYGDSCENWNCTAWSSGETANKDYYCADGWNCSAWNGNICNKWDCLTPTAGADAEDDYYCDRWNCSIWDTDKKVCQKWDCLQWLGGGNNDRDFYCSGIYNCTTWKTFNYDTTPPSSVTNLNNQSAGETWIYWNWTNPTDGDFNESIIYTGGIWKTNTSNNFFNATGLSSGTSYIITVHTKDTAGNINDTDVNSTALTIPTGSLQVTLLTPTPGQTTNVTQNQTFWINATVNCTGQSGALCGNITAYARYNITSSSSTTNYTNISVRVSQSSDDAEEYLDTHSMYLDSSDLELVRDIVDQEIGIRFNNITIPKGATIKNAYIEFEIDEYKTESTNLTIFCEDIDNATTFTTTTHNITNRPKTSASVAWTDVAAPAVDEKLQSPNISSIIQEVVNRAGWTANNSMVFIINGTGIRTVESWDGANTGGELNSAEPLLVINYSTGTSSTEVMTAINVTQGATPFFTTSAQPQSCVLTEGQSCQFNWSVNATGAINDTYKINVNFSSSYNKVEDNETNNATVRISSGAADTTPPYSVTNLTNQSSGETWIYWNWTNPIDDFDQAIVYLDGSNVQNTSNNFYNATSLTCETNYTITIHTKDTAGNVNNTDVTNITSTLACTADEQPAITMEWIEPDKEIIFRDQPKIMTNEEENKEITFLDKVLGTIWTIFT